MTTRRDWSDAEYKRASGCRVGYSEGYESCDGPVELAHSVGRRWDEPREWVLVYESDDSRMERRASFELWVDPDAVVPLCRDHHRAYDAHRLDLLPYLTLEEQAYAASKLGLVRALKRVGGVETPSEEVPQ